MGKATKSAPNLKMVVLSVNLGGNKNLRAYVVAYIKSYVQTLQLNIFKEEKFWVDQFFFLN